MMGRTENPLHLKSLNHISIVCRSVERTIDFCQNVLGFVPVRRPGSFDFECAWLFNYGIGIHLLQSEEPERIFSKRKEEEEEEPERMPKIGHINPKDNHISFQCQSMHSVEKMLKEMEIEYVKGGIEEGGISVD
ncbi:hypothetical protein CDL15_Pgr015328 [Punica granatum]|uniref:VOC domain-containing protein n=1 Tax=Punica granatum TaxID=22663 RepID=A0A218W023_PUNGR|nr:hypothetical protein CDL15_Pgr015328 [Punica granatum]